MSGSVARPTPPSPEQWTEYLGAHGKSFRFALALMPEPYRSRVAGVYAFCRYTDDLIDRGTDDGATMLVTLDRWLEEARHAYEGRPSAVPLLRHVMREMADAEVPFGYVELLIAGMRMDVLGTRYETLDDLRVYCHRVASAVGLWLTELFGVRDGWTLVRAARLGTAMQLTNIVRDVGEDWRRGRLYLPRERMRAHGVTEETLDAMQRAETPVPAGFAALMEELMTVAEVEYREAEAGIARLPEPVRPSIAVAARVYAAIHDAVRANHHDTMRRRAMTSMARKLVVARSALRELDASAAPCAESLLAAPWTMIGDDGSAVGR